MILAFPFRSKLSALGPWTAQLNVIANSKKLQLFITLIYHLPLKRSGYFSI